jgi:hypothetical protein
MESSRARLMSLAFKFAEDYQHLRDRGDGHGAQAAYENYQHALSVALEGTPSHCDAVLDAIVDSSPELLPN